MNLELKIKVTICFQKRVKRLKKRYPHIAEDLAGLQAILSKNPEEGDAIPGLYNRVRKVRMASTDMKKGKSGGFRVIYYYLDIEMGLYLLDVYGKGEQENIKVSEIKRVLEDNFLVLE